MLFIALAIVAAVVVIANDGYDEYLGDHTFQQPIAFDGYDDYQGGADPGAVPEPEPPPVNEENGDANDGYAQYIPGGNDLQNGYISGDPGDAADPDLNEESDSYDAYEGQAAPPTPTPVPAPTSTPPPVMMSMRILPLLGMKTLCL